MGIQVLCLPDTTLQALNMKWIMHACQSCAGRAMQATGASSATAAPSQPAQSTALPQLSPVRVGRSGGSSAASSAEASPEASPGGTPRAADYHHTPRWGGMSAFSEQTLKHLHKLSGPSQPVCSLAVQLSGSACPWPWLTLAVQSANQGRVLVHARPAGFRCVQHHRAERLMSDNVTYAQ